MRATLSDPLGTVPSVVDGEPLISARGLVKRFDDVTVDGIDVS
jgi:hypothetical protein